ncbi:MAG: glycosyltransferase [Mariprofundaceae bacterium]|nr:glycosyltransferase [Mariprofundaceae bacterium]
MNNKEKKERTTLTVITATCNAAACLPRLIASLREQTDRDFEWVVADGASDDGTLELLKGVTDLNLVISSQPDFGIYDALNRAIRIASGEYYIVAGADDLFDHAAIANFRRAIDSSGADIIIAKATYGKRRMEVRKGASWLLGHVAFIASHTLATAFRKDLHRLYGFYSRKFPIAADQLFVMRACEGGASRHESNFVAGEIGHGGVSTMDRVGNATEVFRVQLDLGHSRVVQTLLLMFRLLK